MEHFLHILGLAIHYIQVILESAKKTLKNLTFNSVFLFIDNRF